MSGRIDHRDIESILSEINTKPNTSSSFSVMHFQPSTDPLASREIILPPVGLYKPQDRVDLQLVQEFVIIKGASQKARCQL